MKIRLLSVALFFVAFVAGLAQEVSPIAEAPIGLKGNPRYVITVTQGGQKLGEITLELFPTVAPKHVRNFDSLVSVKFYDGTAFHRVIADFMIQGGDPNTKNKPENMWGVGDGTQTRVPAEFSKIPHKRGILSAARTSDPNSATSQFFICHGNPTFLDEKYTVYGMATSGLEVVDKIATTPKGQADRPTVKVEMTIKKIN